MNYEVTIIFENAPYDAATMEELMQRGVDGSVDATPGMTGWVVAVRELESA